MKKLLGIIAIAAIATAAGWNFIQSQNEVELSDLALANVQALARGETDKHGYYNWDLDCCDTGGTYACYYDCPEEENK